MKTALLLIAHGSREEEANADLNYVLEQMRLRGACEIVGRCYLELATPDIDEAAGHCVADGARRVILLPYFLSAGVHVSRDLSAARERLTSRYPHVDFRLAEPLGRHPLLVDIVVERAREAAAR